jgi:hypothetical protein
MTRNGKIARLSLALREELNERLDEGRPGKELVEWLNSLPEVQNDIRYHFRGQPISEQNLSQWRNGGYRDWQEKEERWHMLHQLREEADQMGYAVNPEETQRHLSVMLTLELGRALRDLLENTADVKERVKGLDRLVGRFAQLRREESHARRVDMEWKLRKRELGSFFDSGFGLGSGIGQLGSEEEETEVVDKKPKVQSPKSKVESESEGQIQGSTEPRPTAKGKARSRKARSKRAKASNGEGGQSGSEQAVPVCSEQEGVSGQPRQSDAGESQRITVDQSSAECGVQSAECEASSVQADASAEPAKAGTLNRAASGCDQMLVNPSKSDPAVWRENGELKMEDGGHETPAKAGTPSGAPTRVDPSSTGDKA